MLNTEASGALHSALRGLEGYTASEYFGPEHRSGDRVCGVLHQDLMKTSFPDRAFDLVISSDVFEHLPEPYGAHEEVLRLLRPGGRHVFTVPFRTDRLLDEVRAVVRPSGAVEHLLEPEMHGDPLRPGGILAFRRFGLESLVRCEEMGFQSRMYGLRAPALGIVGRQAFVFEVRKPQNLTETALTNV